jgi:hypothetical protein
MNGVTTGGTGRHGVSTGDGSRGRVDGESCRRVWTRDTTDGGADWAPRARSIDWSFPRGVWIGASLA